MKLFTYQSLMALLFILCLSSLSDVVSASCEDNLCDEIIISNEVIVPLPDDELTETALRLTLKVSEPSGSDFHQNLPYAISAYAEGNFLDSIETHSIWDVDGTYYYEPTVQIPEELLESWIAMKKETVRVWLELTYGNAWKTSPVSLVEALFVNLSPASPASASASADAPVKREAMKL